MSKSKRDKLKRKLHVYRNIPDKNIWKIDMKIKIKVGGDLEFSSQWIQ